MAAELRGRGSTLRVTFKNQQAIVANLRRLPLEATLDIQELNEIWGNRMAEHAHRLAPLGKEYDPPLHPGFLKDSNEVRFSQNMLTFEVGSWAETFLEADERFYAPYVHFGTSKMPARPWLDEVFAVNTPGYTEDAKSLLKALAKEFGGPGSG